MHSLTLRLSCLNLHYNTHSVLLFSHCIDLHNISQLHNLHVTRQLTTNQNKRRYEGSKSILSQLEETQMYQPRIPHPDTYEWPKNAPDPHEASRERFHEYMRGRPRIFSIPTGSNLSAAAAIALSLFLIILTFRLLRPDDYQWVDKERKRLIAARKKLDRIKARQEKQQKLLDAQEYNESLKHNHTLTPTIPSDQKKLTL